MLTLLILLIPFVTGTLLLFLKNSKLLKSILITSAAIELILTLIAYSNLAPVGFCNELNINWIPELGINFHIGMDGMSFLMLLLTNLLSFFIFLTLKSVNFRRPHKYFGLLAFAQFGLVGVFVSLNAILFYIFWEIALIPVFFLIVVWGEGANKIKVTLKFFIYTLIGSLLMLIAFIFLYQYAPNNASFELSNFYGLHLDSYTQKWLFWFMFAAFAIKMPLFPFHSWQPATYTTAPIQVTMILSAIMLKMGIYGMIRWLIPIFPIGVAEWRYLVIILAITGTLYTAIIALKQKDIKTLFAFASLSHVGLMGAALMVSTQYSLQGVMVQLFAHGINIFALFYFVDLIQKRTNTRQIDELGGIRNVAPVFSALFLIVVLANIALPLTNAFVGEFLIFLGLYQYDAWIMVISGLSIIFGAVYMLYAYQKINLGEANTVTAAFHDLSFDEKVTLTPIILIIFITGIFPQAILNLTQGLVNELVQKF